MTDRTRHGGGWSPWSAHLRIAWARSSIAPWEKFPGTIPVIRLDASGTSRPASDLDAPDPAPSENGSPSADAT